jgi:hypothetical protein
MADKGSTQAVQGWQVLDQAIAALKSGDLKLALSKLAECRGSGKPLKDWNYVRALYFLALGRLEEALFSVREELWNWPEGSDLKPLKDDIEAKLGKDGDADWESDFKELYETVKDYTLVRPKCLYTLYSQAKSLCLAEVSGHFVECGAAAGGSSAVLAWVIKRYSKQPRKVWAFDSFAGHPALSAVDSLSTVPEYTAAYPAASFYAEKTVAESLYAKLGVADLVTLVCGEFSQSLKPALSQLGEISLLHLDSHLYQSTLCALTALYDQLIAGAIVQEDDYKRWAGVRAAILEFEKARQVEFFFNPIDEAAIWFTKP